MLHVSGMGVAATVGVASLSCTNEPSVSISVKESDAAEGTDTLFKENSDSKVAARSVSVSLNV